MRSRTLKPSFFHNEHLAECSPMARLLFTGLWCLADCNGCIENRPKRIKAHIFPFDNCDIEQLLAELGREEYELLVFYSVEGRNYIHIKNFCKHQRCHHQEEQTCPTPPSLPTQPKISRETIEEREPGSCFSEKSANAIRALPPFRAKAREEGRRKTVEGRRQKVEGEQRTRPAPGADENAKGPAPGAEETKPDPAQPNRSSPEKPRRRVVDVSQIAFPPELDTPDCRLAVADWLAYKRERGESYKSPKYLSDLLPAFARDGPAVLINAIRMSMGCNYAGIVRKHSAVGRDQSDPRGTFAARDRYLAGIETNTDQPSAGIVDAEFSVGDSTD